MTTNYPGAVDSFTRPVAGQSRATVSEVGAVDNAYDAIEAIEGELGVNPSGSEATVKARLDALDTTVAAKATTAAVAAGYQPLDSDLTAIAALTTTSYGRALLALADAAALRTAGGVAIGTDVQAFHANLAALAGITGVADRLAYFTGAGALSLATLTPQARTLLAATTAAAQNAVLGVTRTLVTFAPVTPALISGNSYAQSVQNASGTISDYFLSNAAGAISTATAPDGSNEAVGTVTASATYLEIGVASSKPAAVAPSTAYTASYRVRPSRLSVPYRIEIFWYDAGSAFISSSSGASFTPTVAAAHTVTATATSPANAAFARTIVRYVNSADVVAGDTLAVSVACIRTSATIPGSSGVTNAAVFGASCIAIVGGALAVTSSGTSYDGVTYTLPGSAAGTFIVCSGAIALLTAAAARAVNTGLVTTGHRVDGRQVLPSASSMPYFAQAFAVSGYRDSTSAYVRAYFDTTALNGERFQIDPFLFEETE